MTATHARNLLDQAVPDGTMPLTAAELKAEQLALVTELRSREFTASQIGAALNVTEQYARQLLAELGLHKPRRYLSASHAIDSLPAEIRKRLAKFRNQTRR